MKLWIKGLIFFPMRTQSFLRWSRYFFFIIALLALSYVGVVLLDAKLYQADQTRRFQQALQELKPPVGSDEHPNPSPLTARAQMGSASSEGSPLGRIEITRLGLAVMILEGTDERTLQRAVGHIAGTPLPGRQGNVAIAGHRDTFFRALRNIRVDDEIRLTTLDGSYHYRVAFTKVVAPEDIYVLAASDDALLTLVTCYPFSFVGPAPKRFVVRAHRIASQGGPSAVIEDSSRPGTLQPNRSISSTSF